MSDASSVGRPAIRIGDQERHRALDALSTAFAEGRLTAEEFEERSTAALAARTAADLAVLLSDLPSAGSSPASPAVTGTAGESRLVAVLGGVERQGRWRVSPGGLSVVAVMGGVDLDFRQAILDSRHLQMRVVAVMGGVHITVPDDWSVTMSGLSLMAGRHVRGHSATAEPAVHLAVAAWAIMGGVDVRHASRAVSD